MSLPWCSVGVSLFTFYLTQFLSHARHVCPSPSVYCLSPSLGAYTLMKKMLM
eukprot:m.73550 g.73550  ORF g.73550 m.73550 type:complete len:52 (+) comp13039_c2_seq1:2552-2707(+)